VRLIARRIAAVAVVGGALVLGGTGCRDDPGTTGAPSSTVDATTATAKPRGGETQIAAGQRSFERSGCLACHQLSTRGTSGPGDNLTGIGGRMSPAQLRQALVDTTSPMPSFRQLGKAKLEDLVAYLSALRGAAPGGPPCPDDLDCG
jgi:mono/diheme cytochrome c family protein